ncbi:hypothetical protein [Streptomyces sp. OK228]|uniref:hypothetical protein n=1 Tax=Streptomyces sp. OK228 TaxID=1882786 RepID=UPI00117CAC60|nr:hypothetical protein [Streptomyces sp. OK228]
MRGSPARRIVGNPLGSVLANLDQRTRVAARRRTTGSAPSEQDPPPAEAPVRVAAWPAAAVLVTGEDGRAQWAFPAPYAAAPAVSAIAVDPAPEEDDRTVLVALEEVTTWCVAVRVWRTRGRRGTGVAEPAGAGVRVHVTALGVGPVY